MKTLFAQRNFPENLNLSNIYMKNELYKTMQIAPASENKYINIQNQDVTKKKYTNKCNPYVGAQAASIARRNARERNRVKQVNDGFNALRKRLPATVIAALSGGTRRGSGKKLSKVDTLRMVVEYIKYMEKLIDESDAMLGIRKETTVIKKQMEAYDTEEDVFQGRASPYSESVSSPESVYSSGFSSNYSYNNSFPVNLNNFNSEQGCNNIEDDELLDAISWWQQK